MQVYCLAAQYVKGRTLPLQSRHLLNQPNKLTFQFLQTFISLLK